MTIATLLQQRIAAPTANTGDINSLVNSVVGPVMSFLNGALPPLMHILYLVVVICILREIWKSKGFNGWSRTDLMILAVVFGLMKA